MPQETDSILVERALMQDPGACRHLWDMVFGYIRNTLLSHCHDDRSKEIVNEICADLITECFSRGEKGPLLESYDGRASLQTWMCNIGLNRLRNWWKSSRFLRELPAEEVSSPISDAPPADLTAEESGADDEVIASVMRRALRFALLLLDQNELRIIRMAYSKNLTQRDIAALEGSSVATVNRHLHSATNQLNSRVTRYLELYDVDLEITAADLLAMNSRFPGWLDETFLEGGTSPEGNQ
jgi:RNA polymerase sigma factor (sigma-70 family)